MRKISVFINMTVDGFFAGPHGEIDLFQINKKDVEWENIPMGTYQPRNR